MSRPLHRSRIRRRAAGNNGNGSRNNCISPSSSSSAGASALSAILLLLPFCCHTTNASYLGPTHCVKPGTSAAAVVQSTSVGYSTFNHLLFDMVSISTAFKSGQVIPDERLTFKICPGSVIDLDNTSLPLGFLPIEVPRLTLQCGDHGQRGTSDPMTGKSDACIIRGGGKRKTDSDEWNTYPQRAYKNSASGILGGGQGSVAQIYVYGESAYEVTLKGLTFDNSLTQKEMDMYDQYVAQFGQMATEEEESLLAREENKIEQDYESSVNNSWGGAEKVQGERNERNLQDGKVQDEGQHAQPAHRFASVAVRGKGYGDDAGPRLITIEDCCFEYHRGYAVLISPGIQQPDMPVAPKFEFPMPPSGGSGGTVEVNPVNPQISGALYNHGDINLSKNGEEIQPEDTANAGGTRRQLNLLDNGEIYIPQDGLVSYYDDTAGMNYLDGRRVKIVNTEFANNVISGDNVAGLVTSAYSLTLTDCFFQKNNAKAMVFVYNNEALVDNTIFAENTVEVSTVIMASPKGSKPLMETTNKNGQESSAVPVPTHIVERTCFLGSHVGMSNVLVTDVENTGFGQRDNHASGTKFTWVSTCEGGAAEKFGNDCLETGLCDGTCILFDSKECLSDRVNTREFEMFFNGGRSGRNVRNVLVWGLTFVMATVLGAGALC